MKTKQQLTSRRDFVRTCAAGSLVPLAGGSLLRPRTAKAASRTGPAGWRVPLDGDWLFGGKLSDDATKLQFDGVMTGASPAINGHALPEHLGGYLPFRYEISDWLTGGDNVLAVAVDSRWKNVPPEGAPAGPRSIDYLEPGGVFRSVSLCAVPQIFISDVFAKPASVLDSHRRVEVTCSIDAAATVGGKPIQIKTELMDGRRVVSRAQRTLKLETAGRTEVALTLSNPGNIALWDIDTPRLYDVVTTLSIQGKPVHDYRVRVGFREARFDVDGFFLNGRRLQIFGLNRHELYPYVGGAMPRRVLRHDAEILRREFNCNMVRCSH